MVEYPKQKKSELHLVDLNERTTHRVGGHALAGAKPIDWIEAQSAFLCVQDKVEGACFLLDPVSGETREALGQLRPLRWYGLRGLVPTGKPGIYWTTLRGPDLRDDDGTWIGLYDTAAFAFTPVRDLQRMMVDISEILIDEKRDRTHLLYKGHLLRLPLRPR